MGWGQAGRVEHRSRVLGTHVHFTRHCVSVYPYQYTKQKIKGWTFHRDGRLCSARRTPIQLYGFITMRGNNIEPPESIWRTSSGAPMKSRVAVALPASWATCEYTELIA